MPECGAAGVARGNLWKHSHECCWHAVGCLRGHACGPGGFPVPVVGVGGLVGGVCVLGWLLFENCIVDASIFFVCFCGLSYVGHMVDA